MSGIPRYSGQALADVDVLYQGLVDVHFFVEDEEMHNFYESLFARLFPWLKSFAVFPLSGKGSVVAHAQAHGLARAGRSLKIYLLDKDFDDILGKMVVQDNIFYLDDYSIESSVLDEASLLSICVEEQPRKRKAETRAILSYQRNLDGWLPLLDRLHRGFALVQKHGLPIRNVDQAPEAFCAGEDKSTLSEALVDSYIEDVAARLVIDGVIADESEFGELSRKVFGSRRVVFKHISGKFLSRLHYHRLKRLRLISNLKQDSMLMRCCATSDLCRLKNVKAKINRYAKPRLGFK